MKKEKARGVISASAGNQALALAHHGQLLNIPVTVVMPHVTPLMKLELCRQYGASVIIHGNSFFEVSKKTALHCECEDGRRDLQLNSESINLLCVVSVIFTERVQYDYRHT